MSILKNTVGALAVTAALVATLASGESNSAEKVNDTGTSAKSNQKAASKTFKVKEKVKLGDYVFVVHKVQDPLKPTNDMMKPAAGKRWVSVDAEVTNNADTPQTVSSIMCFDLRDSQNKKYSVTITGQSESQLDGEVAAGDSLRGDLEFEIPKAAKGLKLNFKCDFLSTGTATVALS